MRTLLTCLLLGMLTGCSLILGDFKECDATKACTGAGRTCVDNLCVTVNCTQTYGPADAGNAIVLGAALPITTSDGVDQSEITDFNAALLALDEVNQRQIFGRPLVVHQCDTAQNVDTLKRELDYLIKQKGAVAVLTSGSGQSLAALSVTVPAGVLVMTATATSKELTTANDQGLLWRTAPSDEIQSQVIAGLLQDPGTNAYLQNVNKVGILYVDDPYGQGLMDGVSRGLAGAKTVQTFQFPRNGDSSAAMAQLDAFAPDLTLAIAFPPDLIPILKRASTSAHLSRAQGHRWFFTDSAKDLSLLTDATTQDEASGAYGTEPAQGAGPAYATFAQRFKARYGVDASSYSFTSHSYDAMYLLALSAAWASGPTHTEAVTGVKMAEGLKHVSSGTAYELSPTNFTSAATALAAHTDVNVNGASGALDFDPATGEAPSPIEVWHVVGNHFERVTTLQP